MSGVNPAQLAEVGQRLLSTKFFSISMYSLWLYDYFLTLGDEINYAWVGRKSWIFALFIANRYTPVLHVLYKGFAMFYLTKCKKTVWEIIFYTTVTLVLAQITICLRIYAVTGRNKLLCCALSVLIVAQLGFGIYFTFENATAPLPPLPAINLDAFKVCVPASWRAGELAFTSISVAFDLLTFLIILVTVVRSKTRKFPGLPNLLAAILRDATVYFLLIVTSQLVLFFFLFFAPTQIQLLPGVSHAMFLPVMSSRLMLSLRKAAARPVEPWSISTMGERSKGRSTGDGIRHFVSQKLKVSQGTSTTLVSPSTEDIELDSAHRLPRNRGSQLPC